MKPRKRYSGECKRHDYTDIVPLIIKWSRDDTLELEAKLSNSSQCTSRTYESAIRNVRSIDNSAWDQRIVSMTVDRFYLSKPNMRFTSKTNCDCVNMTNATYDHNTQLSAYPCKHGFMLNEATIKERVRCIDLYLSSHIHGNNNRRYMCKSGTYRVNLKREIILVESSEPIDTTPTMIRYKKRISIPIQNGKMSLDLTEVHTQYNDTPSINRDKNRCTTCHHVSVPEISKTGETDSTREISNTYKQSCYDSNLRDQAQCDSCPMMIRTYEVEIELVRGRWGDYIVPYEVCSSFYTAIHTYLYETILKESRRETSDWVG
jgi:hypothetical protein